MHRLTTEPLTYDWMGQTHEIRGSSIPDDEVARRVRMLMRNDLDHEAVCTLGRDRIMALSKEVARCRPYEAAYNSLLQSVRAHREALNRCDGTSAVELASNLDTEIDVLDNVIEMHTTPDLVPSPINERLRTLLTEMVSIVQAHTMPAPDKPTRPWNRAEAARQYLESITP